MADLKKFLGVLFALGVGNNARMSIREMTSDLRMNRFVRVGFLTEHKINAQYMSNWFMNLHLQPDGWENSDEAKRPKTARDPGPGTVRAGAGAGAGASLSSALMGRESRVTMPPMSLSSALMGRESRATMAPGCRGGRPRRPPRPSPTR